MYVHVYYSYIHITLNQRSLQLIADRHFSVEAQKRTQTCCASSLVLAFPAGAPHLRRLDREARGRADEEAPGRFARECEHRQRAKRPDAKDCDRLP